MSVWDKEPTIKTDSKNRNVVVDINQVQNIPTATSNSLKDKLLWIGLGIVICILAAASFAIPFGVSLAIQTPQTTDSTISTATVTTTQSITTTYGGLTNNGLDDADAGLVVIDYTNVIPSYNGPIISRYIQDVSFNFSIAPSTSTPTIWLYVMNMTTPPNVFVPATTYQLPSGLIATGATGAQTMQIPVNALPVSTNQYIAVGFASGGGSCYQVSGRNQYYLSSPNFGSLSSATYTTWAYGFAFSFTVKTIIPVTG